MALVHALGAIVALVADNLHVKVGDDYKTLTEFFDTEAVDNFMKELEK